MNTPWPEDDPTALNVPGPTCGMNGSGRNYDHPKNIYGNPMPPVIQDCYAPGGEIVLEVLLTAGHDGHFEYKACPVGLFNNIASQECFDSNPLEFISDELYSMPKDDAYTERAYIPWAQSRFKHKYRLPAGLEGELVLIHTWYRRKMKGLTNHA